MTAHLLSLDFSLIKYEDILLLIGIFPRLSDENQRNVFRVLISCFDCRGLHFDGTSQDKGLRQRADFIGQAWTIAKQNETCATSATRELAHLIEIAPNPFDVVVGDLTTGLVLEIAPVAFAKALKRHANEPGPPCIRSFLISHPEFLLDVYSKIDTPDEATIATSRPPPPPPAKKGCAKRTPTKVKTVHPACGGCGNRACGSCLGVCRGCKSRPCQCMDEEVPPPKGSCVECDSRPCVCERAVDSDSE